jgi:exodeoxyribonuclease VII small subunit
VAALQISADDRLLCYNARMAARRPNEFEKAFQNLEKIVQRLESEELPLDESLGLFEEGIRLSRFCHQRLEEVEKKIELILADAKGQPVTEPFEPAEDEEPLDDGV